MLVLFIHWNSTTNNNEYIIKHNASEVIPTPPPKRNESVGREGE